MTSQNCACNEIEKLPMSLDGISVIIFKKYPILRTHLVKLLSACWLQKHFPVVSERATVSLDPKERGLG